MIPLSTKNSPQGTKQKEGKNMLVNLKNRVVLVIVVVIMVLSQVACGGECPHGSCASGISDSVFRPAGALLDDAMDDGGIFGD